MPVTQALDLVVLTGLSGAGRSTAARALEDIGFMVIDNLPPQLLSATIDTVAAGGQISRLAIVADARGERSLVHWSHQLTRFAKKCRV